VKESVPGFASILTRSLDNYIYDMHKKVLNLKKQFSISISEHHDKVRKDDIVFTVDRA
jgi:hypothetical protein